MAAATLGLGTKFAVECADGEVGAAAGKAAKWMAPWALARQHRGLQLIHDCPRGLGHETREKFASNFGNAATS
eukprot:5761966-Amphidinium_carterae.1